MPQFRSISRHSQLPLPTRRTRGIARLVNNHQLSQERHSSTGAVEVDKSTILPPVSSSPHSDSLTNSRFERLRNAAPFSSFLTDSFHRQHTYLRISITERCNLRCTYCMPEAGVPLSPENDNLTTPEILLLSELFVSQGVDKIRLTGGEPTIRKDILSLMQRLGDLRGKGLKELALTTNGVALWRKLDAMAEAGLTGVNLSLDTLDPHLFQIITRRKGFDAVIKSMDRIQELNKLGAGIKLKINCVVTRGVNDREILDFVELGREKDIEIRFIEYMPFDGNKWEKKKMFSYEEMLQIIRSRYPNIRRIHDKKGETSKTWQIPGFVGRVGFITSMTENFCGTCNRLRITSDGNLKVCLFGNSEVSLRDLLRESTSGAPLDEAAFEAMREIEGSPRAGPDELPTVLKDPVREAQLLDVIGKAVGRKKARHAGMENLSSMPNRPMILIDELQSSFSRALNTRETLFATSNALQANRRMHLADHPLFESPPQSRFVSQYSIPGGPTFSIGSKKHRKVVITAKAARKAARLAGCSEEEAVRKGKEAATARATGIGHWEALGQLQPGQYRRPDLKMRPDGGDLKAAIGRAIAGLRDKREVNLPLLTPEQKELVFTEVNESLKKGNMKHWVLSSPAWRYSGRKSLPTIEEYIETWTPSYQLSKARSKYEKAMVRPEVSHRPQLGMRATTADNQKILGDSPLMQDPRREPYLQPGSDTGDASETARPHGRADLVRRISSGHSFETGNLSETAQSIGNPVPIRRMNDFQPSFAMRDVSETAQPHGKPDPIRRTTDMRRFYFRSEVSTGFRNTFTHLNAMGDVVRYSNKPGAPRSTHIPDGAFDVKDDPESGLKVNEPALASFEQNEDTKSWPQDLVAGMIPDKQKYNVKAPDPRNTPGGKAQFSTSSHRTHNSHFPHLTPESSVHMVSVGSKQETHRIAVAIATVTFAEPEILCAIRSHAVKKGDVLSVARIAAIMGAKRTSDIIPLCHPGLQITNVEVDVEAVDRYDPSRETPSRFELDVPPGVNEDSIDVKLSTAKRRWMEKGTGVHGGVKILAKVACYGKTGVEMEALMAVSAGALTVIDMCKALDKNLRIEEAKMVYKAGGRSGTYVDTQWQHS